MKLRSDSFAARLTPTQREELFAALAGGLSLIDAAKKVHDWTKAEWGGKPPSAQAISAWFQGAKVERRFAVAKESSRVAQANAPANIDAETRKALGQAKFLAVLEELAPRDIAVLEKNEIAKDKLDLDRTKVANDNRVQRLKLLLERAKLLLERARGGEKSQDLQQQIDLALEEIEKMKHGEDGA